MEHEKVDFVDAEGADWCLAESGDYEGTHSWGNADLEGLSHN